MGIDFKVRHLTTSDIPRAFPLMQTAYAQLTFDQWTRFATAQLAVDRRLFVKSGIVAVERGNGYLYGLFSYAVTENGLAGRVLTCDHFVVVDFLSIGQPMVTLIEAAEKIGRDNLCRQTQLCIPTVWTSPPMSYSPIVTLLGKSGFDCESIRFQGIERWSEAIRRSEDAGHLSEIR